MKILFAILMAAFMAVPALADNKQPNTNEADVHAIGKQYFAAMVATQAPDATAADLENFLALLTDDVGSMHLPYQPDDSREPNGKQQMRKGMTFYLAAHTEYNAELLDIIAFNNTAVAVRYKHSAKGIHPQHKQPIAYTMQIMDILEIEDGKIAVIRKYHE